MAGVEAFFPRLFYLGSSTSTASAVSMMSATCEREVRDGTPEPARAAAFFSFESDSLRPLSRGAVGAVRPPDRPL